MRIVVLEESSGKRVTLEVEPNHTVGSIIGVVMDGLGLSRNERYVLTLDEKDLDSESTIRAVGVGEGAALHLKPITRLEGEKKAECGEITGPAPRFCLQCGKPLRAGSKFCLSCGASVRE
jgi:hypothetical protein